MESGGQAMGRAGEVDRPQLGAMGPGQIDGRKKDCMGVLLSW